MLAKDIDISMELTVLSLISAQQERVLENLEIWSWKLVLKERDVIYSYSDIY